VRFLRPSLLLFGACLAGLAGCERDQREEEIVVDTVTHPDREPIRLRVGAIQRGEVIWFFRISGPKDEVANHEAEFNEFVRSAKFAEEKEQHAEPVVWTEPKSWRKDPPGGMRYAGFRIKAQPKELEVTVTRLPAGENWLLTNVHRWQKQVNVPAAAKIEDFKPEEVQKEKEITWVDLKGLGVHIVSKPPERIAAGNAKKFQLPQVKKAAPAGKKVPFDYDLPEGWEQAPLTGKFMVERYVLAQGEVQVTLTPVGGTLAMNVNRWRDEIGLPAIAEAAVKESAMTLKFADIKADYVEIINPRGPAAKNHTLGVIIPTPQTNWVIKMWGPTNLVGQNKNAFETFVKSFKPDAR
jgi:hypothetical protein